MRATNPLHHAALAEKVHGGTVAHAFHAASDLPLVRLRHVYKDTSPKSAHARTSAAAVAKAMTETGDATAALVACGLAREKDDAVHPVAFRATYGNVEALRDLVAQLCGQPGAQQHMIAGRREAIVPFETANGVLLASPYLGFVQDRDVDGVDTDAVAFVGLFGSATSDGGPPSSFKEALQAMASETPATHGEHRDDDTQMKGLDEDSWRAFARAFAISCPQTREALASGRALKAVLTARTPRRDCAMSFLETTADGVFHKQTEVEIEGSHAELIDALCRRPIMTGHRSTTIVGFGRPFAIMTRASAFSIHPSQLHEDVAQRVESATMRAAMSASLSCAETIASARGHVHAVARTFAPELSRHFAEDAP